MPHDRSNVHEGHLYDIIADFTESAADRRALEAWYRNPGVDRTLLLVVALEEGLMRDVWPWSNKQATCGIVESEWVSDAKGRPGRRLRMRHCYAAQGHDGAHTFGEWGSR